MIADSCRKGLKRDIVGTFPAEEAMKLAMESYMVRAILSPLRLARGEGEGRSSGPGWLPAGSKAEEKMGRHKRKRENKQKAKDEVSMEWCRQYSLGNVSKTFKGTKPSEAIS